MVNGARALLTFCERSYTVKNVLTVIEERVIEARPADEMEIAVFPHAHASCSCCLL